jgi:hypothetical protein
MGLLAPQFWSVATYAQPRPISSVQDSPSVGYDGWQTAQPHSHLCTPSLWAGVASKHLTPLTMTALFSYFTILPQR